MQARAWIAFVVCAAALVALPAAAAPRPVSAARLAPAVVAFLPFVAGDPGLPYSIFPTRSERDALGKRLGDIVQRTGGSVVTNGTSVRNAIARAGFDQDSAYRACNDAVCARSIGRSLRANRVVYGSVTRYLAMIWGTEVSIVDVRTGATLGPYALGYKGDYLSLSMGLGDLAKSIAVAIGHPSGGASPGARSPRSSR